MDQAAKLSKNLVKIRKAKGFTQERLAYESGISKGFLSEIEAGKKSPTIKTLAKIAETLEVSLSKLVS